MIATIISQLIEFLQHHPYLCYSAVFLLAMSESLPVFGAVIPGTAIIVALSALVPSGVLVLWPLLAAATGGAIAGDGFSFWLGHRYDRRILSTWPFSHYPAAVRHSEIFVARYGARSIFFARFLPGVRAFVPLLAGIFGMQVARFYVVNIFSAAIWAPAHILPGVLLGTAFHAFGPAAKPLAGLIFTVAALAWLMVLVTRFAVRKAISLLEEWAAAWQRTLAPKRDPLSKFMLRLLDPNRTETRVIAILFLFTIATAWLFFGILEDVFTGDPLVNVDGAIYNLLQGFRSRPSDSLMVAITELGDTTMVVAISGVVAAYLLWRRAKHAFIYFVSAVAGASLINTAIKVALHRTRPIDNLYAGWSAFSFPSGHSTVNMALYGAIAFLIVRYASGRMPLLAVGAAAVGVLSIAFSRIYLGAHWFSDVAGGIAFGLAWLSMLGLLLLQRPREGVNPVVLAALPVAVLVLFGTQHIASRHAVDMTRYAVQQEVDRMALSDWWASDFKQGDRRTDITGDREELFALHWAGLLETLQGALQATGWQVAARWQLQTVSALIAPDRLNSNIPPVPLLSAGQFPEAVLTYPLQKADARLTLRIWRQSIEIEGRNAAPLWKATVTQDKVRHLMHFLAIPTEEGDGSRPATPRFVEALTRLKAHYRAEGTIVYAYDRSLD